MRELVLYSRPGCHLCDDMHAELRAMLPADCRVRVVNIDDDPALRDRFGLRIPVLAMDGDVLCEARLDADAVQDALRLPRRGR